MAGSKSRGERGGLRVGIHLYGSNARRSTSFSELQRPYPAAQRQKEMHLNVYIVKVMAKWAKRILDGDGVCVPDIDEEMNWRLFFAHMQDMQGFRADIFTSGSNEAKHPTDSPYRGLRDRWSDSRRMMDGLARLWENSASQQVLRRYSNPHRPEVDKRAGIQPIMDLLRGANGNPATRVFADALDAFRGYKISKKTNAMIRAYAQNAAILRPHDLSFRNYLLSIHPIPEREAAQVERAECAWLSAMNRDFYNVGPALANYLICDWLLGLWREGRIDWFRSYKADSIFIKTLVQDGKLPIKSEDEFVEYCCGLEMLPEWTSHPRLIGAPIPPRLLNEAIWLEENKSS